MIFQYFHNIFSFLNFRIPATDAGGRRNERFDISFPVATGLCAYTASLNAAFPGCPCPVHHGSVQGGNHREVQTCVAV